MKIGLAEMDILWEDKTINKVKCQKFIEKAKLNDVDIIFFPEMTLTGFSMNIELVGDRFFETLHWFQAQAIEYAINIGFGTVELEDLNGKNVFYIISSKGEVLNRYEKIHPFSFGEESIYYKSGNKISISKVDDITVSPFVCYDLRFPEIFQIASKEAQFIIIAANWPKERIEHWTTLLKARAIENQCYIAGVNRTGTGNGIIYNGCSMLIDPLGKEIFHTVFLESDSYFEKLIIGDTDANTVITLRNNFKLKQDRKENLYKEMMK